MIDEYANSQLGNLIEPDALVWHEHLKTQLRSLPADPEQILLLAVLKDAVETFQRLHNANTRAARRLFREAQDWIWSEEADRVFSFIHICDMLSLDPGYIRQGLRKWMEARGRETALDVWDRAEPATTVSALPAHVPGGGSEENRAPRTPRIEQRANGSAHIRRGGYNNSATRLVPRRGGSARQYPKRA